MDKLHSNGDPQKISVNGSGENNSTENKFVSMVWDTVNRILDKFLSRHPQEKELREFMADESNLYGVDGKPTEEYKLRIEEMEKYIKKNSVDDDIKSTLVHDEVEEEMYTSIIDFINRRTEIIREFTEAEDLEEDEFSADDFIKNIISNQSSSEEERKQLLEMIENLAEEDALDALDNEEVRSKFKEIINSKSQSETE